MILRKVRHFYVADMTRMRPIRMLVQPKPSSCSLPRLSPLFDTDSRCTSVANIATISAADVVLPTFSRLLP